MTTEDAARDMEEIRKALGEDKLSYLGFSYGTFLGAVYANLFPDRVRAFVLDGAVDPTQSFVDSLETQSKGFADALNRFLDNCEGRATCQFNGGRNVRETFDQVMADIDAQPLAADAIGDPRLVGPGEAFTGVLSALYDGVVEHPRAGTRARAPRRRFAPAPARGLVQPAATPTVITRTSLPPTSR